MQKHWLERIGAPDLIVVALGWASEPRLVQNISDRGARRAGPVRLTGRRSRSRQPIRPPMDRSRCWPGRSAYGPPSRSAGTFRFRRAVALNGTPLPVDARYGIPPQAMAVTRQGIRRTGTDLFDRRAYGTYYDRLSETLHTRPLEELCDELDALSEAAEPNRARPENISNGARPS